MKDGKKTAVPKLRFPEFRDAWDNKVLAPYLEECGSRVPATTSLPIYSSSRSGLTPQASYYNGRTIINDGEYGVVPPNCFVYRHMSDDGQFAFNVNETGEDIAVSKEYPVFRTINLDYRFLHAKLNHSQDFKAFALSQKAGGTRTRLYYSKLRLWETYLPSLPEQQKIADCLSSLDKLIAVQGKKVETLKTYKLGLVQQLFPRAGETVPRLRFPEFCNAPEWNVQPLCKIAENLDNKRVPITESERTKGSVPYYGASGVVDYVKDYLFDEELLCVSEDGANLIARTYPIAFPITGKSWVNNHAHVLRFKNSATQKIVQDYLNSVDLQDFITGMAQPKLNRAMLDRIPVPLPDVEEGKKLAGFLFATDSYLAGVSGVLDSLITHKNGLIQQLFPSQEEA